MEIPVSCNKDCGGGCPLLAVVENGRIVKITDNPGRGRWMSGCLRGYRAHQYAARPDRLTKPLLRNRRSGKFQEIGWDSALDLAASELSRVKAESGPLSVMRLGGSGSCRGALHNTAALAIRFLNLFGGFTETSGNFSSAAVSFVTPYVFGTGNAAVDAGSLMDAKFVFLPGANTADLRFGPELMNRLRALSRQGVEMIVTDPRRTRTPAALDARWIGIRPGTDAAMLAAVIYDLCENGGIDLDYIDKYCSGWDAFRSRLFSRPFKSPEWASEICGTPAADIRYIAECYRKYRPAALIPGLSIQRTLGGEEAAGMAMILQAVTGNTGRRGGTSGANIWGPMPNPVCGKIDTAPGELRGLKKRRFPVYGWAERVLDRSLDPPIRLLYNCGGNYITQGPGQARSEAAFAAADFSITHDLFMTPTAAASDLVLPVTDFLERSDIVFPEGNFLLWSGKAAEPPEGVPTDYEIFGRLAARLGFGGAFTEGRSESGWLDLFIGQSEIEDPEEFKRGGIYFGSDDARVALSDFIEDPAGKPLNTPSGKIELSPRKYEEAGGHPFLSAEGPCCSSARGGGDLSGADGPEFRLITPHSRMRINSQQFGKAPEASLLINEDDARGLGIADGSPVEVSGGSGTMRLPVSLSRDIISGVVCLEAGDWQFSPNRLTSSEPTMPSGGARTHSTHVRIRGCNTEDEL